MLSRRLSSFSSSIRPRGLPTLCQVGCRSSSSSSSSSRLTPAPHPWWSGPGFPPWPPSRPTARQAATVRSPKPCTFMPGGWCSFHTSAGCTMERPDRDREPSKKRRKSGEEKRSKEEKGAHRGGAEATAVGMKEAESRRERDRLGPTNSYSLRSDQHVRDERWERERSGSRWSSRDALGRTQTGNKDQHGDDGRAGTPNPLSQPAGSRTGTPASRPEQDPSSAHKSKPWFRGGAAEESGGNQRNPTGPPEHPGSAALQRFWEVCSSEPHPPGDGSVFDFSVMSYNILSQDLLQDNSYLYRHCPPGVLPWTYRLPNLLTEIQQHDADILCLQEVQEDHYENQIKPALQKLGYQCEFKRRTGSKPDGCAISFKSSRLSLLSSNPVEFFRPGDPLLDRDNVGLVVLLQPSDGAGPPGSSPFICVANTHLLYNPRRGDIKLAQLAILLAEIHRLSRLPDGAANPVVLCGDFNSVPWSPLYSFLTRGSLEYQGLQIGTVSGQETSPRGQRVLTSPIWSPSLGITHECRYESPAPSCRSAASRTQGLTSKAAAGLHGGRIEHSLKLRSSYPHRLTPDGRPEITTCHSRTALTVDYILYSPAVSTEPWFPGARGLQLLGRLSLVGQSELEEVHGLPNPCHSSDHLPLLAGFRFWR